MNSHAAAEAIIDDSDSLILVDEADREVGHLSKAMCHEGSGTRHRAFSVLIFNATGAEHELCSVFIGRCTKPVSINRDEIHAWRWVRPDQLQAEMSAIGANRFTPWFMMECRRKCGTSRAIRLE